MNSIKYIFWLLGGAQINILEQCPVREKTNFGAKGALILTTAVLTTIGIYYVLKYSLQVSFGICLVLALLFTMVDLITNVSIARVLTTTKRTFFLLIPRLALGWFIAVAISTPLADRLLKEQITIELSNSRQLHIDSVLSIKSKEYYPSDLTLFRQEVEKKKQQLDIINHDYLLLLDKGVTPNNPKLLELRRQENYLRWDISKLDVRIDSLNADWHRKVIYIKKGLDSIESPQYSSYSFLARIEAIKSITQKSRSARYILWMLNVLIQLIIVTPVMIGYFTRNGTYEYLLLMSNSQSVHSAKRNVAIKQEIVEKYSSKYFDLLPLRRSPRIFNPLDIFIRNSLESTNLSFVRKQITTSWHKDQPAINRDFSSILKDLAKAFKKLNKKGGSDE